MACIMVSGAGAAAETTELNPMVVTATRSSVSLADAPAAMTVITAEQIRARGATNLLEALRGTPGITLNGRQVGGRKTLSIRGAEDRHTLVLIDGRRISSTDDTIGHSDYQYGWVGIEQIERIEVVRGPMSALYGSEAIGGVINIITRQAQREWSGGVTLRGDVGQGDTGNGHRLAARASGPLAESLDVAMAVEEVRRESTPWEQDRRVSEMEGQDRQTGSLAISYRPFEGQTLKLDLLRSDETRDRDQQYAYYARPIYLDTYELERRQNSLAWNADWGDLQSQLRFTRSEFDVTNKRTHNLAPTRPQSIHDDVWDGSLNFHIGEDHALTVGGEHRDERLENAGLIGGSDSATHQAVFIQDEIALATGWALTLGARLDDHEIFGRETSPRAWLVWRATPELTFKAGYGEAFRAPTLKQISPNYVGAEGPHTFLGNADIKPETSRSFELGVDWHDERGAYTANLYRNEIDDLIYYRRLRTEPGIPPRTIYQYDNIEQARIEGLELTGRRELGYGIALGATVDWMDPRDARTDAKLNGRPEFTATPSLEWTMAKWNALVQWEYIGKQYLEGSNGQERAPGYSVVNASLGYRLHDNLTLRGGVLNIGNVRLEDKSELFGYAEQGRTGWLAVEAGF
ncbi:MAG: TonB-dependent receptor [Pseudomonas stutzeri]|nr:TonB-dependent receptor [Stutzerimonas stutzeri]NIM55722.1 TonB-dependent receptor [Stutzerimonas stutzeri]NIM87158.1 TonB-dependent receptor [Stutzerimonas stutzeri]NIN81818.1 TonB-dependent receptor [Stutzerimonas stutzeri]NIP01065.1 TonB-dependent receptor [Stutzerimonas stutzeri]